MGSRRARPVRERHGIRQKASAWEAKESNPNVAPRSVALTIATRTLLQSIEVRSGLKEIGEM